MGMIDKVAALVRPEDSEAPASFGKRIAAARERVQDANRELDAASLAIEENAVGATQTLERARRRHADAVAEVDQLERAQRRAIERESAVQRQKQAEARREEARECRERVTRLRASVVKADAAFGAFVGALQDVMRHQSAVAEVAPHPVREVIGQANEKFAVCLSWRLRFMPGVKHHPFMTDAAAQWAQYFPGAEPDPEEAKR